MHFFRPTRTATISLTGHSCQLQCAHCNGHYLRHMQPIWEADPDGATSCLISGGCDSRGRVPIAAHVDRVAELHAGRRLNWHVGLTAEDELRRIAPYVDVISFDIVGDAMTAREVYGLDVDLDEYLATFDLLRQYALTVPHITIGLHAGHIEGERRALEALASRAVEALVLLVLIPTEGTAYADCSPPPLAEVAELLIDARNLLPETRIYLGCMRPHGEYRQALDVLALRAGLNAIVNPTRAAEREAEGLGLRAVWGDECCAFQ